MTQHRGRVRALAATAAASLLSTTALIASAASPAAAAGVVNNPPVLPHSILVFPSRSFISASGYAADDVVRVSVIHPVDALGNVGTVNSVDMIPADDPGTPEFDGIVEINHPGGGCWVTNTPDIRPGDNVRLSIVNKPGAAVDETTVADVTTDLPTDTALDGSPLPAGTVQVHGAAQDFRAPGTPLPVDQLEQRLVIPGDAFDLNGKRTLRATSAGAEGLLSYDAPGSTHWTATYSNLSALDVGRALNGDARAHWLGTNPATLAEATIFENGAGFTKASIPGCNAPLERRVPPAGSELFPPTVPQNLATTVGGGNNVSLAWSPSVDNPDPATGRSSGIASYGIYRDGVPIGNVSAGPNEPTQYIDKNVPAGGYSYTIDAEDGVGNRSAVSAPVPATATANPAPLGAVNEPPVAPRSLIAFPSRDFVSTSGFSAGDLVNVYLIRNGVTISTSEGLIPTDSPKTPQFDGIVEVNHPGGGCWDGTTPRMLPGDKIRAIAFNTNEVTGATTATSDQTTVSDVAANPPTLTRPDGSALPAGTVQIHGTATAASGDPLPAAQIDTRLVSKGNLFAVNGRRTLRAGTGTDGTFSYDAPGSTHWTATYSNLSPADVDRAMSAESRILWLGADPAALTETTIFENGLTHGAQPPCAGQSEAADTAPPTAPRSVTASLVGTAVHLAWNASQDNLGVRYYGIYRDGLLLRQVGASTTAFDVTNAFGGSHVYSVDAVDASGNRSAATPAAALTIPDKNAPSSPTLSATVVSADVDLSWTAASDDVGVAGYRLYRDGAEIANFSASASSFRDVNVVPGNHSYTVDAVDAAGNRSARSAPVAVTVTADRLPPTTPGNLSVSSADFTNVLLSWSASTDNAGVTNYRIYRDGTLIRTLTGTPLARTFTDPNVAAGIHAYAVDAGDASGNRSAQTAPISVRTNPAPVPTAPSQNLAAGSQVTLDATPANSTIPVSVNWSAPSGAVRYEVQQSVGGGAFTPVTLPNDLATAVTQDLRLGTNAAPGSYQFRVRSCNADTCSAYTTGARFTLQPIDEGVTAATAFNGAWATGTVPGAYGGGVRFTTTAGARGTLNKATFAVRGNVAWLTTFGPDRGSASVSVDGGAATTVNLNAPTQQAGQVGAVFNGLAAGTHTVTVTDLTGRVDVDGFIVIR
ncbi:MAG: large repetitive protein [Frankiaceae bacterium]|nr:large repetitive protein [Frankiaceae bacterium]